jgi:4-amino-4-deoxy-L-arabinose transferase-like glycosyltransferase
MKRGTKLAFVCIIALASVLRLWQIQEVPPGVNRDEASIGFTALSLLKTGRDEYGKQLPLSFESFGDWKLPLYIYTTVPFVAALGPTELAIRLPSAAAGIATVGLTFFLVYELLGGTALALLAAFALSVSPWHLHLSRVESESNIAVFFVTTGLLLFLKSFKKHTHAWFLPASAVLFALTYYTYHGNHITTTLFLAGLVFIYRKSIPKGNIRVISIALFLLISGFILAQTFTQADKTKIAGISIFGDPAVVHEKIELPRNAAPDPSALVTRLRYNRVTFAIQTVTRNYLAAFSPEFLFFKGGGNHAHNIEGIGNFYLIDGVFMILGVLALLKMRKRAPAQFLLWWLLIAPVAASITKDAPHTNRMFAIFPLPAILIALGALPLLSRRALHWGLGLAYGISILLYLRLYHIEFPKNEAQHWGYSYKKLVPYLTGAYKDSNVIMSHPEQSPYIFLLLYMNYDPALYQREAVRYPPTPDAFVHVASFGRFAFREINWKEDLRPNTVIVEYFEKVPTAYQNSVVQTILGPDGTPTFAIVSAYP